jgi:hypothetical protein
MMSNKQRVIRRAPTKPWRNGPLSPPPFDPVITVAKRLRFQTATTLVNVNVSAVDLFDMVCVATSASAASQLFRSLRIREIEIWGPMPQALTPVTTSIEFYNDSGSNVGAPSKIVSDTSMGSMRAAHCRYRPPARSGPGLWLVPDSTGAVFTLNGPAGSVVDLSFTGTCQDENAPGTVTAVVAGATAGKLYIRALDSNGAKDLVPVSYSTI